MYLIFTDRVNYYIINIFVPGIAAGAETLYNNKQAFDKKNYLAEIYIYPND